MALRFCIKNVKRRDGQYQLEAGKVEQLEVGGYVWVDKEPIFTSSELKIIKTEEA
jgi:hypothetical protein